MLLKRTLPSLAILIMFGSPATAQMYPGQDVTVNPNAIPQGEVLMYPGGHYMQVSPAYGPYQPIHLHMPRPHRHVAKAATPPATSVASATPDATAPDASATAPLPAPTPDIASQPAPDTTTTASKPAHHAKHEKTVAAAQPAPQPAAAPAADASQNQGEIPLEFAGDGPAPSATQSPPPSQPTKPAKAQKVAATEPPPAQTGQPPSDSAHQNLFKHGAIMFTQGATDPSPAQFDGVKQLAADLNAALESGASRIQIEAYGGAPGDKSSDARRLSLKRALAVRQLLIDDGVPSNRIDVRAMGGVDDKGPADRVDVFVRAS